MVDCDACLLMPVALRLIETILQETLLVMHRTRWLQRSLVGREPSGMQASATKPSRTMYGHDLPFGLGLVQGVYVQYL